MVHPTALELLNRFNFPVEGLCSKSWDEFATSDPPFMDFVITVCDKAAAEQCPVWPGRLMTAHWGFPDPAQASGDDLGKMMAFRPAFRELENRMKIFVNLHLESLDSLKLQQTLNTIGKTKLTESDVEPIA